MLLFVLIAAIFVPLFDLENKTSSYWLLIKDIIKETIVDAQGLSVF